MSSSHNQPQSARAKFVFFIWNSMPRFILLGLIAMIVVLFFAVRKESELIAANKAASIQQEKPPVNTVTLQLSPATISDRINLPGSMEAWTELGLLAKIGGTIEEMFVEEGDNVKKGEVLARVEEADYRIALDSARAAYNLAKADYQRDQSIYDKGMIPTAEIEARKTKMQTAKADLERAELHLSRCEIISPMDGVIKNLDAKIGLQLSIGDPIATILEIDRLKAVVGIPESDVSAVRKLNSVELTVAALDDKVITAERHFLAPSPGTVARLYDLELVIDNDSGEYMPGMFVRADIVKEMVGNAVTVPFYSVISRNDEQFVFIEQDGVVEKRNVTLGIMERWMVQITEGLDGTENLVVEGHRDIEDNQKVRVVKALTSPEELML